MLRQGQKRSQDWDRTRSTAQIYVASSFLDRMLLTITHLPDILVGLIPGFIGKQRRAVTRQKQDLIVQLSSLDNSVATEAAYVLRQKGWLTNGSLNRAYLKEANLQNAPLMGAQLQKSFLLSANLQNTHLTKANLRQATIIMADLKGANLASANLSQSSLAYANLEGVVLHGADLRGADMLYANLQDADLRNALFDKNTLLPDGSKWQPASDLSQFVNPAHPRFWRSDQQQSPAYG